jgi:hypothetical protein
VFALKQIGAQVLAGVRASQREEAAVLHADEVVALENPKDLKQPGLSTPWRIRLEVGWRVPYRPTFRRDREADQHEAESVDAGSDFEGCGGQGIVDPNSANLPLPQTRKAHAVGEKDVNGKILLAV